MTPWSGIGTGADQRSAVHGAAGVDVRVGCGDGATVVGAAVAGADGVGDAIAAGAAHAADAIVSASAIPRNGVIQAPLSCASPSREVSPRGSPLRHARDRRA